VRIDGLYEVAFGAALAVFFCAIILILEVPIALAFYPHTRATSKELFLSGLLLASQGVFVLGGMWAKNTLRPRLLRGNRVASNYANLQG
jgi:hypothetical protein